MILQVPDRRLRKKTQEAEGPNPLAEEALRKALPEDALGLAAPQIGLNESLIILPGNVLLYNLSVTGEGIKEPGIEGCLSIPGRSFVVERFQKISWRARNSSWQEVAGEAEGLVARILQHESDHLRGILILDYGREIISEEVS